MKCRLFTNLFDRKKKTFKFRHKNKFLKFSLYIFQRHSIDKFVKKKIHFHLNHSAFGTIYALEFSCNLTTACNE